MARLINLKTFTDTRGSLTVIERVIPFEIKRIFYVNGPDQFKNRNKRMMQAVICMKGSCLIANHTATEEQYFALNMADQCLLLGHEDRYEMVEITGDAILMVLASEPFGLEERVEEPYQYELSLT